MTNRKIMEMPSTPEAEPMPSLGNNALQDWLSKEESLLEKMSNSTGKTEARSLVHDMPKYLSERFPQREVFIDGIPYKAVKIGDFEFPNRDHPAHDANSVELVVYAKASNMKSTVYT
jgi:hypothetical protein